MESKFKNISTVLLLLIVIYNAQGALYPVGETKIAQTAIGLIYIISGFYFLKILKKGWLKKDFLFIWSLFLTVNILSFAFTGSFDKPGHFGSLRNILLAFLPFYPFYYFSKQGILQKNKLIIFFAVVVFLNVMTFHKQQIEFLLELNRENPVYNIAYTFTYMMPFAFLFTRKKMIGAGFMLLIYYYVVLGSKRGAFITASVGLLIYGYYFLRVLSRKVDVKTILMASIGSLLIGYFSIDFILSNPFLVERIKSTGGEARNLIYESLWMSWYNNENSFSELIFGFGFVSSRSLSYTGHMAHNDWLELLTSLGLVGVMTYFILFITFFRYVLKVKWGAFDKRIILFATLILWFIPTFFSMGYVSSNGMYRCILLGCLFGLPQYSINNNK